VLLSCLPALAILLLYEAFLGHRHDYAGHFAAGYGATLAALMLWLRVLSPESFSRYALLALGPMCVAAILVGALAEATAFRIAKFDEIDFCNQSLGAVLATVVAAAYVGPNKPRETFFDLGMLIGIAFLSVGGCFAVA
jgi:hypothetical protein